MENPVVKKALVIDDDAVSRKKLSRILQRLGIEQVEEANDGEEALARIQEESFDLVMADWHMPGMTGLELLKSLRKVEAHKHTLAYMVTSEDRQGPILEAIHAGANGYIIKPFSQDVIKQKLAGIFSGGPTHKNSTASHTLGNPENSQESPESGSAPHTPTHANTESSLAESTKGPS